MTSTFNLNDHVNTQSPNFINELNIGFSYEYNNITIINRVDEDSHDNEININDIDVSIFRFKFTDGVMELLNHFAKIHQYDDRHAFKEAWTAWLDENDEAIEDEVNRLENLGYEGDILDKMFKSARYYYRKKSTEKKVPKERRQYVSVQRELLDSMDSHIKKSIMCDINFKPQNGFIDFCISNRDVLQEAVAKLCESGITSSQEIQAKVKKTYKNRYFMIVRKDTISPSS
uniref:Uncharacterized protein n=1 Tax=viral metagenome TaxID=1070528 RepID=A0A6C0F5M2_9ZZZZ